MERCTHKEGKRWENVDREGGCRGGGGDVQGPCVTYFCYVGWSDYKPAFLYPPCQTWRSAASVMLTGRLA